jgi:MFS family permease
VVGPALISDLFAPRMLGRALSIFYLGLPLGGTAAFLLAGAFYGIGWRNLFLLAGFPGLLVAAVLLLVPDPRTAAPHAHAPSPLRSYLGLLRTRSLLYVILAQACAVVVLIPIIHFGVHFFEETRGMAAREARIAIGLIALIAGSLGNAVSGVLGDRLSQRFRGAYALLAGTSFLLGWPCLLFGFFLESRWLFLPAITAGCFFYFLCMPAVNAHIARVVRPNERAMAWALATFVLHLLGDMLSPPLFGIVSEGIGRRDTFAIFSLGIVVAGLLCLLAARTAGSDAEHARYRPLHQPSPKRPQ